MSFFTSPNPFGTAVGQLIDAATDAVEATEDDVQMNFEICDLINAKEENAKDAMRAIRKKLSLFCGKNW